MTSPKNESKIFLRAKVLEAILKFKTQTVPSDFEVENCIKTLLSIENLDFVTNLLLKEITGDCSVYDNILSLILLEITEPKFLSEQVFEFLNDPKVSDIKKLYLVNLLSEHGEQLDMGYVASLVKDPDGAISEQTKKFLQAAIVNPEVQIDFYDFYFAVNDEDRELLINSMVEDYSGDELANIMSMFLYFYPSIKPDKFIFDTLSNTKSYIALDSIKWFLSVAKEKELLKLAKNALNKLRLSGLNLELSHSEVYEKLLSNSKPLGFWFSHIDGQDNLSSIFAREKDDGSIQTFFTVFNLKSGPIAAFGFDKISKDDFEAVISRFFKSDVCAKLSSSDGKLLFDELSKPFWQNEKHSFSYEFPIWRQLTFDILPSELSYDEFLTKNLKKIIIDGQIVTDVLNSSFFSSWFYKAQDNELLAKVVDRINSKSDLDIKFIEGIIYVAVRTYFEDENLVELFKKRIILQAYLCLKSDMQNLANLLYTITLKEDMLKFALTFMYKKSVYVHYFEKVQEQNEADGNIFSKKKKKNEKIALNNPVDILNLVEGAWV